MISTAKSTSRSRRVLLIGGATLLVGLALAVAPQARAQAIQTAPGSTVGGNFTAGSGQTSPGATDYRNRPSAPQGSGQTSGGRYVGSDDSVVTGGALAAGTAPSCTVSASPATVIAGSTSTVSATCTQAPTGYNWTVGGGGPVPTGVGSTMTFSTPGTYTYSVVATNPWGNSPSSNTVTVTVNPPAPVCTLTGNPVAITVGSTSTLAASCTNGPTSYTWSAVPSTGFTPSPSGAGGTITFNTAGSYDFMVRATNAGGTGAYSATVTIVVSAPAPVCTLTASPAVVTAGGSATLTGTCTNAPTSFGWVASGVAPGTPGNVSTVTHTFNTTGTANYQIRGTNAGGTGAYSNVATVTVNPGPPPSCTLVASPSTVTLGASTTLTATCTNTPSSYTWTNPANGGLAGVGTSSRTATPTATGTFTYSVTATNVWGTSLSASASVTVLPPAPVCNLTATPSTISQGSSSTLTANCTNSPTSYTWTNPAGGIVCSNGGCFGAFPTPGTYTYQVRATNAGGTSATSSATVTVTAIPVPVCTVTASPASVYVGQNSTITTSCTNTPTSYWLAASPASGSGFSSGAVSTTITTPTAAGSYTFTGTGTNAGGSGSGSAVLTAVTPPPTCNASSISAGFSGNTLTWSVSGLANLSQVKAAGWSTGPDLQWVWGSISGSTGSGSFAPFTAPGTYNVHVYMDSPAYPNTFCGGITVTKPAPSTPPSCSMSSSNYSPYVGDTVTVTLSCNQTIVSSYWLTWAPGFVVPIPDGTIFPTSATAVSRTFVVPQAGSYGWTAAGRNAAGQDNPWGQSYTSFVATARPAPTCWLAQDQAATVSGSQFNLSWGYTNATSATMNISVNGAGWTPVGCNTASASGSCPQSPVTVGSAAYLLWLSGPGGTGSCTVSHTVNAAGSPPSCTLTASPASITAGGASTLTASCPGATSITWQNAVGGPAFSGTGGAGVFPTAGNFAYWVQGTNAYGTGAWASANVAVTNPAPPAVSCTLTAWPTPIVAGGQSTLTASCPGATFIEWTNPANAPAFSGTGGTGTFNTAGSFTYFVRGYNGSSYGAFASANVLVNPPSRDNTAVARNASVACTGWFITYDNSTGRATLQSPTAVAPFTYTVVVQYTAANDGSPYWSGPGSLVSTTGAASCGGSQETAAWAPWFDVSYTSSGL